MNSDRLDILIQINMSLGMTDTVAALEEFEKLRAAVRAWRDWRMSEIESPDEELFDVETELAALVREEEVANGK